MKNYIQPGKTLTVTAPEGGVSSGDGVLVGSLFGVAATSALVGADVEISLVGVFELPKATGEIAAGALAYWDASEKKVVAAPATDTVVIGAATQLAGSSAATARVRLNGIAIAT